MNKQQAQQIIKDTFESAFDKGKFTNFIVNLLNLKAEQIEYKHPYSGKFIPDSYKQSINTLERIAKYTDGEYIIDVLIVKLKKGTSLERARTTQRNFIAWYLNGSRGGEMKDAALAAFVSPDEEDWRFSLVKMDYKFEKTKTGKMKTKEDFTPARRWSFLVGANEKSHTAQSRLVKILANDEQAPNLQEIEKAFDIETVSKEFFLKYRELFMRTKEELDRVVKKNPEVKADFETTGVDTVNFAKKLLGQIIFLYFLQKKGWFGVGRDDHWGTGSKHFLRELFKKKHSDYNNFFNDILEPLFYDALSRDRSDIDHWNDHFKCKIPFLNGGLFDPIGNYSWYKTDILLSNELFSNKNKTKEGDTGDGILDIFDRYNFTVKEDEPLEKEVAIDPELLGKSYEKFNAIRPDNFDEFRKALKSGKKGEENKFNKKFAVYYTPREIVHYMCKQSLINYLHTQANEAKLSLPIKKKDLEDLIEVGELIFEHEATALSKQEKIKNGIQKSSEYTLLLSDGVRENAEAIDEWLENITVCDPAVGSGAFPVGMMSEIVRARNVLSVFISQEETQNLASQRSPYEFKRRCIEHSLYGVDIDPGAVEIAKLRLWLSLVVDEEDIKNIKPLPNLDYKVVCGNSLLGVEKDLFNAHLFSELEKLKPLFFNETNPTKKQTYKTQIDDLISQITNGHTEFDFEVYFSEVFHQKGGFDVVIGNPPYQGFQILNKEFKNDLKRRYESTQGKFDLYIPFIEKCLDLLKMDGFFSFICPTAFCKREHGKHIRRLLLNRVILNELIDFEHSQIFDSATNYTGIFSFFNSPHLKKKKYFGYKAGFSGENVYIDQSKLSDESWIFTDAKSMAIFEKIKKNLILEKIAIISEGVVTGLNELFLKTLAEIREMNFEQEYFFPIYRGKEVYRYYIKKNSQFLFYPYVIENEKTVPVEEAILRKKNPNYYKYLSENKSLIENRPYFARSQKKWYELWNQRKLNNFKKEKIITPELSDKSSFMIASPNTFYGDTVCGIQLRAEVLDKITLKYLLAILNSNLIEWFYKKTTVPKAGGFFIYKVMYLKMIPIILCKQNEQLHITSIVDCIHVIAKDEDYLKNPQKQAKVKALEAEIDQLVYRLYDLTEEEIKIVEKN
jgi:hypothetical protein